MHLLPANIFSLTTIVLVRNSNHSLISLRLISRSEIVCIVFVLCVAITAKAIYLDSRVDITVCVGHHSLSGHEVLGWHLVYWQQLAMSVFRSGIGV